MQTTKKELLAQVEYIQGLATGYEILEGSKWEEDIPAHLVGSRFEFPHLGLDEGSATYGRAWRIYASGGSKYRTAHFDPFHMGSGFLGMTKNEAMTTLRGIRAGLLAMHEANVKQWDEVDEEAVNDRLHGEEVGA